MSKKTAKKTTPKKAAKPSAVAVFQTEHVAIESLKPHPRNYRKHPDDQIEHLVRSLTEHGFYRNVVVAQDGTILAGHGVVLAGRRWD